MAENLVLNVTLDNVRRLSLSKEENVKHTIPFTNLRVWNNFAALLPTTAATDDLAIIDGTFGTGSPSVQGIDFGGTTTVAYARFNYIIPANWVSTVKVELHAGMLTTVADTKAEWDIEAYESDGEAGIGADLCQTVAQAFNDTSLASKSFVIDSAGLAVGDLLDIRIKFDGEDAGNLGVMTPILGRLSMVMDIRG
jgi:hypothetical protein